MKKPHYFLYRKVFECSTFKAYDDARHSAALLEHPIPKYFLPLILKIKVQKFISINIMERY